MIRSTKWIIIERAEVVLERLREGSNVAELPRWHEFDQLQFYRWREAFLAEVVLHRHQQL